MECMNCGHAYDPNRTGWKCPSCGWKDHCCDGGECS
jgi:rubredoxin